MRKNRSAGRVGSNVNRVGVVPRLLQFHFVAGGGEPVDDAELARAVVPHFLFLLGGQGVVFFFIQKESLMIQKEVYFGKKFIQGFVIIFSSKMN